MAYTVRDKFLVIKISVGKYFKVNKKQNVCMLCAARGVIHVECRMNACDVTCMQSEIGTRQVAGGRWLF